jgi:hypothetical protein
MEDALILMIGCAVMIECPWCSNEVEIKDGKCPRYNYKLDVVTEEDFQDLILSITIFSLSHAITADLLRSMIRIF